MFNSVLRNLFGVLLFFPVMTALADEANDIHVEMTSASAIRFDKELELAFSNLRTLGTRIDESLFEPNPLTLALCALELQAAEAAAEKKSSYDSDRLLLYAVDLAQCRGDIAELSAMKTFVPDRIKELDLTIKRVKASQGEVSRGISVLVIANPQEKFRVYLNGYFCGFALPERENTYLLGCPHHVTTLEIKTLTGDIVVTKRWEGDNIENEFRIDNLKP